MKTSGWLMAFALAAFLAGCGPKSPTSTGVGVIVLNTWTGTNLSNEPIYSSGSTGLYVWPYPGTSLSSVILWINVGTAGNYTFNMTAKDTNNGQTIGSASTGSISIPINPLYNPVTFTFSGDPGVNKGDQVSFAISCPSGSSEFNTQSSTANNLYVNAMSGGTTLSTGAAVVVYGND